ncbi:MAG TPA: hypothetical protein VK468_02635 [Pyrinomonadaceae bacterium]|nr:hypothetical protein [Pyrinomonadaceae bacterium]
MKTFYILAWILVAIAAVVSFVTGYFNSATLVAFSLTALALVYALALWSVITNTPDMMPKVFHRNDES